jgi:hypothetical protein
MKTNVPINRFLAAKNLGASTGQPLPYNPDHDAQNARERKNKPKLG